jgi:hypothetical protein
MKASRISCAALLFSGACGLVSAQETGASPFLAADAALGYDTNVTRQRSGAGVQGSSIQQYGLEAGYDRETGRERVHAFADVERSQFHGSPLYDNTKQLAQLGLALDPLARTEIGIDLTHLSQLSNQADFAVIQKNMVTANSASGYARVPLLSSWSGVVNLHAGRSRNSNALEVPTNVDDRQAGAGLRYESGAKNFVDLLYLARRATYPEPGAAAFGLVPYREHDLDLRVQWHFSPKNELTGHGGYMQRRYDTYRWQDFAGPTVDFTWHWQPGVKLGGDAVVLRATGAPGDNAFLSAVTHRLRVVGFYQATTRIRFELDAERATSDYLTDLQQSPTSPGIASQRSDVVHIYGYKCEWTPRPELRLGLGLHHEVRGSTVAEWQYRDLVWMFTVQGRV